MAKQLEQLREQYRALQQQWESLSAQEREALEAGNQEAWLSVEYRRRRLPLEAIDNIVARVKLTQQQLERMLQQSQRDSKAIVEQIRTKREALDALVAELNELERQYAQGEPVEGEPVLFTLIERRSLISHDEARERVRLRLQQTQDVLNALERLREDVMQNDAKATQLVSDWLAGEPTYALPSHPLALLTRFI